MSATVTRGDLLERTPRPVRMVPAIVPKLHMDVTLTPNMAACLGSMRIEGGNALTYRVADIMRATGMARSSVAAALDAMYGKGKVEKIDTGLAVYWRRA